MSNLIDEHSQTLNTPKASVYFAHFCQQPTMPLMTKNYLMQYIAKSFWVGLAVLFVSLILCA